MPANFVVGDLTIPPGNNSTGFTFSWPPGQQPNKGPVFIMLSPNHPSRPEDVRLTVHPYSKCRSSSGPVYYHFRVSNSCSQTVKARLMGVYFPEFQSDWSM